MVTTFCRPIACFSDQVAQLRPILCRAAVHGSRAPSVHNTQPWQFVLRGGVLELYADWSRHVPASDPQGRQLLMSGGCALLNVRATFAAAGYAVETQRFPDPCRPHLLATVAVVDDERPDAALGRLEAAIDIRRTYRGIFTGGPLDPSGMGWLVDAAHAEQAKLIPAPDAACRAAFDELTATAQQIRNADPVYRAELRAWTSPERMRLDGVPGALAALEGSHYRRAAVGSPAASLYDGPAAPGCLALCTGRDDEAAWLRAGEALERVLLEIASRGLAARPMTQVIEVPRLRAQLNAFGLGALHPQVVVLVGQAPAVPLTTRRRRLVDVIREEPRTSEEAVSGRRGDVSASTSTRPEWIAVAATPKETTLVNSDPRRNDSFVTT
jgi:hypothetical protein